MGNARRSKVVQLLTNEWSESKEVLVTEGRRGRTSEEGGRRTRGGEKGAVLSVLAWAINPSEGP